MAASSPCTAGLTRIEPGVAFIDLSTKTVLPGLIDSHVHLSSDRGGEQALLAEFRDDKPAPRVRDPDERHEDAACGLHHRPQPRRRGRDIGAARSGQARLGAGARASSTRARAFRRPAATWTGAARSTTTWSRICPSPENLCDSVESCRRVVRRQIDRGADVIKFATTGGVNSGTGLATRMFEDEAKALVQTAHAYGRKVAVHAHGADGIKLALRAGADSIEHGTVMDDEILRLFKQTGAYYVPTLSTVNGYIERLAKDPNAYTGAVKEQIEWRIGITGQSLKKAYPAGVKIAYGTDAGVSKHGRNADEFELLVKFGMPPAEAIKAATVNAADLLGLSNEIGTIEPGKSADIIAVAGDPLTDVKVLKNVAFVMARGDVVKDER